MPVATCRTCGSITNSALSNYSHPLEKDGKTPKEIGKVTRCWARYAEMEERWVEGCSYGDIDFYKKKMVDKLIKGGLYDYPTGS